MEGEGPGCRCLRSKTGICEGANKYYPKTGWIIAKIVPKTGSYTEIVIHKTGCSVGTTTETGTLLNYMILIPKTGGYRNQTQNWASHILVLDLRHLYPQVIS